MRGTILPANHTLVSKISHSHTHALMKSIIHVTGLIPSLSLEHWGLLNYLLMPGDRFSPYF